MGESKTSKREQVTMFSKKSQKRLSWVYSQGDWKSMITLTYHKDFPSNYKESKKHLNAFLQMLRIDKLKYLWVVEFQGRGFPHYHIWLNVELNQIDKERYIKTWLNETIEYNQDEASNFHLNGERVYIKWEVDLSLNYAAKYAQKQNQKWLPIGVKTFGRWWGSSRRIIIPLLDITIMLDNPENNEYKDELNKKMKDFRRNVKKCIFHWSKRKKRTLFDKKINQGFTYILNKNRMKCINRLYDFAIEQYNNVTGVADEQIYIHEKLNVWEFA